MAENIEFRLKVIEDKLGVILSENEKKAKSLGSALSVAIGTFASTAATKGLSLVANGFRDLASFALDSVQAASESEAALNKLSVALSQTGQLTEESLKSFEDFAAQLQATTAFEDDAIITNAALIQSLAKLDSEGLQRATKAAADLASTFNIDLETASRIVGKAAEGNIVSLQRLGLEFAKGVNDAETFSNVLQSIEQRFGGAAQAQSKTFAGTIAQLSNTWGDLKENVGAAITQSPAVIAAFSAIREAVIKASQAIKSIFVNLDQDLLAEAFRKTLDVTAALLVGLDAVVRAVTVVAEAFTFSMNLVSLSIVAPTAGLLKLISLIPVIGDTFKVAADAAVNEMFRLNDVVQQGLRAIGQAATQDTGLIALTGQIAEVRNNFDVFYNDLKNKSNDLKNNPVRIFDPEDEGQDKRIQQAKDAALEAERNYLVAKDQLALENDIAERERFLAKTTEQLEQLKSFELQKSQIQYDAAVANANLLPTLEEKTLAKSKALREKEIRDLQIQNKSKADIRANDIANQQAFFSAASTLASAKSKELAAIGKAAAITEIAIRTPKAVAQSYEFGTSFGGPALGAALGAIAFTAMSAQAAKVAGVAFANGGIVGATMGGDNRVATIRDGEMVLNAEQQEKLFNMINAGGVGGDIVVQVDGREIARAVRSQVQQGFRLA